ncbi:gamma-butyrobetaine dioxygenase [Trebonia kvetii]|uniref:Gamma-butyrobetaine dioxygenase n=1 Tax=Trebonia kvetii TaxID=2480626 RepID=A0A6P2C614_9ACTN|nr:gamma-butyrobetaine dioxygenase [Trebonia kvetii]
MSVEFTPEGHRAVFRRAWLAAHALPPAPAFPPGSANAARSPWLAGLAGVPRPAAATAGETPVPEPSGSAAASFVPGPDAGGGPDADPRTEDGKRLWCAADLAGDALPSADWAAYLADDAAREACLDAVAMLGFVLLHGVDPEPDMVLRVAETFGYVRETNYGRLFDVRVVADPANLAFTSREIAPHTDNPYRDPVPTLQLLHCLRSADIGGDSGLVDGFAAAAELRRTDPASFAVLTSTSWRFEYADNTAELSAIQPLISLTPGGRIAAVRLNNRSMQPLRLPYAQAEAAYDAYRAWATLLGRPEFRLTLRLAPGDCLIFDNTRLLHARSAFAVPEGGTGERHLQGCYADIDGLLSALALLRRHQQRDEARGVG